MNLSGNVAPSSDKKLSVSKPTLNPHAAEFVPSFFRTPAASVTSPGASSKFANTSPATPGKAILDRSESSVSNKSDEEAQQYWRHQLPDDIIPDFNTMGIDDTQGINKLPFSSMSSTDTNDGSRYSASMGRSFNSRSYPEEPKYPISSSYGEYPSPTSFQPSLAKPWDEHVGRNNQLLASEHLYNGDLEHGFLSEMPNEPLMENTDVSPIDFLASQFPGFAADSLAEVYFANEGDLNLTIEMLAQLELQVDGGGLSQALNSKTLSAPNLGAMDFPALSPTNNQNGLAKFSGNDIHQNSGPFRAPEKDNMLLFRSSSSIPSSGATDFASAVRKMAASQESSIWKFDRNGSSNSNIGSSRNPQVLASSYSSGQGRDTYGSRLQNQGSPRASPAWLETGEAVGSMYSDMREDARDHARVRNAYFEQARQAYLIGNKALAKELSIKGQLHNMQMKAAHAKAQESIYRQRNSDMQVNGRERMIDLHGLHVSEAIHVLKRELAVLKHTARATDQRLLVYICVGTGHHTRGSRTPARLPTAVQRYLLEEEGLDYSEPQAGLLRVVIY